MIVGSELGKLFEEKTLASFEQVPGTEAALEAVRRWQRGERPWLVLLGPVGTGKTHLAIALTKWYDDQHKILVAGEPYNAAHVEFWTVPEFFEAMDRYQREEKVSPFVRVLEADLVVLDDLGAENSSAEDRRGRWMLSKLHEIFDFRYRQKKRTIVTTNLTPEQLSKRYGDRLLSRMAEMGFCVAIEASDYRQRMTA